MDDMGGMRFDGVRRVRHAVAMFVETVEHRHIVARIPDDVHVVVGYFIEIQIKGKTIGLRTPLRGDFDHLTKPHEVELGVLFGQLSGDLLRLGFLLFGQADHHHQFIGSALLDFVVENVIGTGAAFPIDALDRFVGEIHERRDMGGQRFRHDEGMVAGRQQE